MQHDRYDSDYNSEIGVHVWSDFGSFTCLRHLFRSTRLKYDINLKNDIFPLHVF